MYTACSEHVVFMYWTRNSMNNLLSYCGLVDARISASEKNLPVCMLEQYLAVIRFFNKPFIKSLTTSFYSASQWIFALKNKCLKIPIFWGAILNSFVNNGINFRTLNLKQHYSYSGDRAVKESDSRAKNWTNKNAYLINVPISI